MIVCGNSKTGSLPVSMEVRMEEGLNELVITSGIIKTYFDKLVDNLSLDCAVVGVGPAGLMAAYELAKNEVKVGLFEKKMSIGGGIWGGGAMFNQIIIQREAKEIFDELEIKTEEFKEGYFIANSVEMATKLTAKTIDAGVQIFNLWEIEDLIIKQDRVSGIVMNWTAVNMSGLHIDPIAVGAQFVVEATGHPTELANILAKRGLISLPKGEGALWAENAEKLVLENTKELFPGLVIAGMAANAYFGAPRMGPIFGGMLLSGKRTAEIIAEKL